MLKNKNEKLPFCFFLKNLFHIFDNWPASSGKLNERNVKYLKSKRSLMRIGNMSFGTSFNHWEVLSSIICWRSIDSKLSSVGFDEYFDLTLILEENSASKECEKLARIFLVNVLTKLSPTPVSKIRKLNISAETIIEKSFEFQNFVNMTTHTC